MLSNYYVLFIPLYTIVFMYTIYFKLRLLVDGQYDASVESGT